jgi:hypothetical protein
VRGRYDHAHAALGHSSLDPILSSNDRANSRHARGALYFHVIHPRVPFFEANATTPVLLRRFQEMAGVLPIYFLLPYFFWFFLCTDFRTDFAPRA